MSESSRQALVVPITLRPHSNADSLSLIDIDGFQVVGNTEAWTGVQTAVYIEPETIVDTTRPEFSWLKREGRDKEIIRAKRLRGEWSVGLLVPTPNGFGLGDNCWDYFGLEHYEPEPEVDGLLTGHSHPAPPYWNNLSRYDLENFKKYKYLLRDDDLISVSEKLNGSNQSCVFSNGELHVKSRNLWKKDDGQSDFWMGLHKNENLKKFLTDNENHLVQGELIGKVRNFTYGLNGEVEFRAFDIRKPDYTYMNSIEFYDTCNKYGIRTPRTFFHEEFYSLEKILSVTDGDQENNPKGIREGVVIKLCKERFEQKLNGRLCLKNVSNVYLEKQK